MAEGFQPGGVLFEQLVRAGRLEAIFTGRQDACLHFRGSVKYAVSVAAGNVTYRLLSPLGMMIPSHRVKNCPA